MKLQYVSALTVIALAGGIAVAGSQSSFAASTSHFQVRPLNTGGTERAASTLPFSDGFESYVGGANTSTATTTRLTQASHAAWTGDGQPTSGWQIANDAVGGSGAAGGSNWVISSAPGANAGKWNWTYSPTTDFSVNHAIFTSADVKLVSPTSGTVNRNTVIGLQEYDAAVDVVAQIDLVMDTENLYGLGANRMLIEFQGDDPLSGLAYDLGVSNSLNQYINVGLAVDYTTGKVYGFVNGTQLPDVLTTAFTTDYHDTDMFMAAGSTATGGARARGGFDNYEVHAGNVPTPGAVALLGLGGLVAGRRRRA